MFLFAGSLLLLPLTTFAEQTHEWRFSTTQALQGWTGQGQAQTVANGNGMKIQAIEDAFLIRENDSTMSIDGFFLTYTAETDTQISILWSHSGIPDGQLSQLPIFLPRADLPTRIGIDPTFLDTWHNNPTTIGFFFSAGTTVTIQSLQAVHYNVFEKITEAAKGMFVMDSTNSSTINFLWGPRLVFSAAARSELFKTLPPRALSAHWLLYGIIIVVGLAAVARRRSQRTVGSAILIVIAILWIGYDLRMGMEAVAKAQTDWRMLQSDPSVFRNVSAVNALVDAINAESDAMYVLFPASRYPVLGQLRYRTFPKRPLLAEEEGSQAVGLWAILDRPDIQVDANGTLSLNGTVLSQSGSVVAPIAPGTFLYRKAP